MSSGIVAPPNDSRALLDDAKKRLIDHQGWREYVDKIYSIDQGDFPFLTYVGINFTESKIKNFKFYFSFFRRMSGPELDVVLPVAHRGRFDGFYAKWRPTKNYDTIHRGATFAIKVDDRGRLTHYYHLRLPGRPAGEPARLVLAPSDRDQLHGVCEEFEGSASRFKRYFYCRDGATIRASLERAGFSDQLDELPAIEWLEYIESEGRDKVAWITASRPLLTALVERRGPPNLRPTLEMFCRRLGVLPFGPGSARDGTDHSIYFVLPSGAQAGNGFVFDGVRHFMRHYLRMR